MQILTCFLLAVLIGTAQADSSKLRERLLKTSKELGHEEFKERQAALERMQKLVEGKKNEALPHLRDLWNQEKDPEIRTRLFGLASDLFLKKKNAFFGFQFSLGKRLTLEKRTCLSIAIIEIVKGTPAETGGLKKGDLLLGIGDALLDPGSSQDDVLNFFKKQPRDRALKLRVRRQEKDIIIPVQPGEQDLTAEELRLLKLQLLDWLLLKEAA